MVDYWYMLFWDFYIVIYILHKMNGTNFSLLLYFKKIKMITIIDQIGKYVLSILFHLPIIFHFSFIFLVSMFMFVAATPFFWTMLIIIIFLSLQEFLVKSAWRFRLSKK